MKLFWYKLKNFFRKFPHRFGKTSMRAVYDTDLIHLIESLGVKEAIEAGTYTCKFCYTPITFENLQAIQKEEGELKFICSKAECFSKI